MKKSIILAILIVFLISTPVFATDVGVTSGFPKTLSWGNNIVLFYKLTGITDGDVLSTGLGTRVQWFFITQTTDSDDTADLGINVTESTGTFTFNPGKDEITANFFVGI